MKDYDEARLRHYLLDRLNQGEKDQVEQELLVDDDLFEAAEAVEDDLLGAYHRGELTARERESLERRLAASPRGQARLELAQGLATLADESKRVVPFRPAAAPVERVKRRPLLRFAMAACLAGVVALGLWQAMSPPATTVTVIAFSVNETLTRSGGGERQSAALAPAGRLRLEFPDLQREEFPAYEVVVSHADGEVARERIKSGHTSVEVPAKSLPDGLYGLEVRGLPAEGEPHPVIRSEFEILAE